jgi:tetratricopeptide (TPR) repeat protein
MHARLIERCQTMTHQDTTVTIDLGDSAGAQRLAFVEVQRVIGEYLNTSNFAQAASVSMQLANQLPEDVWPQLVAAESLYLHQQVEPAFRYIDRALKINPRDIASLVVKSRLCVYVGDQIQAVRLIDSAVSLAPGNSKLHSVKAELLVDAGDIEGARDAYLKAIELDACNTGGLLGLSQLPGDNYSDELIKRIEFIVQSRQLRTEEKIKAHFALAHAYDKKGNVTRHFAHLNAGSNLKNQSLGFDPGVAAQETQNIIGFFSRQFFARRSGADGNSANIIFIIGFPRCGSTLIEQILSSHPSVSAAGESFALRHAIRDFQLSRDLSTGYPYWIDEQSAGALTAIADDYLQNVRQFNQSAYLTDKLLDNYKFVGVIHLVFPNATIINVQRNPVDVTYSCYKRLFNLNSVPFTYNLENLASAYRNYRRVMQHWNTVLPGKIHTVEYEQLVYGQEKVTRDLLARCGLPWNDACLNFHENVRTVQTSSNIQVRQPLYADSIDRWKACDEYLGPLLELDND